MKTARVPAGPILSTADIVADEQYQQRGMFHQARPPSGGAGGAHMAAAWQLLTGVLLTAVAWSPAAVKLAC